LTGRSFFPHLISSPFGQGLHYAFDFAIVCSVVAALASWLRGPQPVYEHGPTLLRIEEELLGTAQLAGISVDQGDEVIEPTE
jgi:hypothetical protein